MACMSSSCSSETFKMVEETQSNVSDATSKLSAVDEKVAFLIALMNKPEEEQRPLLLQLLNELYKNGQRNDFLMMKMMRASHLLPNLALPSSGSRLQQQESLLQKDVAAGMSMIESNASFKGQCSIDGCRRNNIADAGKNVGHPSEGKGKAIMSSGVRASCSGSNDKGKGKEIMSSGVSASCSGINDSSVHSIEGLDPSTPEQFEQFWEACHSLMASPDNWPYSIPSSLTGAYAAEEGTTDAGCLPCLPMKMLLDSLLMSMKLKRAEEKKHVTVSLSVEEPRERSRLIPIYVKEEGKKIEKKAEFDLLDCFGYYTLAKKIQTLYTDDDQGEVNNVLPHAAWPWAPVYCKAEYYSWKRDADSVTLDPLLLSWENFSSQLDNVFMNKRERPALIPVQITRRRDDKTVVEHDLSINRSAVARGDLSFFAVRRAIYLYHCSYSEEDPADILPDEPWPMASCLYLDQDGKQLHQEPEVLELELPSDGHEALMIEGSDGEPDDFLSSLFRVKIWL